MGRRLLTLWILCLLGLSAGERWYGSYQKAREAALREKKDLLVYLVPLEDLRTAPLLKTLRKNPVLRHRLFAAFVPVILAAKSRSRYPIELYYLPVLPALFLMDPAREVPLAPPLSGPSASDPKAVEELWRRLFPVKTPSSLSR